MLSAFHSQWLLVRVLWMSWYLGLKDCFMSYNMLLLWAKHGGNPVTCCKFGKKNICNVLGQSASVQDQVSMVYCISLKVKLRPGITALPEQARSCSTPAHGTRMFLSAVHLPFAHLSLKSHGFYSSWMSMLQSCICWSVTCGFCWFTVFKIQNVALHLSPQCTEIICPEYQAAH